MHIPWHPRAVPENAARPDRLSTFTFSCGKTPQNPDFHGVSSTNPPLNLPPNPSCRRAESLIAPYLTQLQERLRPHNVQVGSYPILYKGVFVSLIGRGSPQEGAIQLNEIAKEVEGEIGGRILTDEEVVEHKRLAESKFKEEQAAAKAKESSETREALKVGGGDGVVKAKY